MIAKTIITTAHQWFCTEERQRAEIAIHKSYIILLKKIERKKWETL